MKRLFSAALLALFIHGVLFKIDAGLISNKSIIAPKVRDVTVTMSYRQTVKPPEPILKQVLKPVLKKKAKLKKIPLKVEKPKAIVPEPEKSQKVENKLTIDNVLEEETDKLEKFIDTDLQNQSDDSIDQVVHKAAPLYHLNPPPVYPRKAKRRGWTGTVVLMVHVDQNGRVKNLWVFLSSGYMVLDNTAIKSVKNWIFKPGKRGNKLVDTWIKQPVRFHLE